MQLIIGAGGTGKSYLINQQYSGPNFIRIGPNHSVNNVINGRTIYNLTNSPRGKLSSKGIKFDKPVIIDEVFLFSKQEMKIILECLNGQSLTMFGDPFQISSQAYNSTYFYQAFDTQYIQPTWLTQYKRTQDEKLIQIFEKFRKEKKIQCQGLFPDLLFEEIIKKIDSEQFTILTGTHQRIKTLQKRINRYTIGFYGSDGKKYRINQRVALLNKNGSIYAFDQIMLYELKDGMITITLKNSGDQKPTEKNGSLSYPFVSADVLTVNQVQGQTIETGIICDVKKFFSFGSFYTAISRVRQSNKIFLYDSIGCHPFECDRENIYLQGEAE